MRLKALGRLVAKDLPPKFLRAHRKTCPICLAMKRRKNPTPEALSVDELSGLLPWEQVFTDASGKWRHKSALGNHYYSLFMCAKRGTTVYIAYPKRSSFPLAYLNFVTRIGTHPKVLFSDLAGEQTSDDFELTLKIKGTRHLTVPKDEHYSIGPVEKKIQDLDLAIKATIADANLPRRYWCTVGEHCNLVLMMTSPSRYDKDITIFEATYDRIPNLQLLPRVGCFCVRIESRRQRHDQKLDPLNTPGVFIGFATLKSTYGTVIATAKSLVVARENCAFDEETMPYHKKESAHDRMQSLNRLLGRIDHSSHESAQHAADSGESGLVPTLLHDKSSSSDSGGDQSSDDEETSKVMKTLTSHAAFTTPSYNDLMPVTDTCDLPVSTNKHDDSQVEDDDANSCSSKDSVPRSKRTRLPRQQFTPALDPKKKKKGTRLRLGKLGLLGRKKSPATAARQSLSVAKLRANKSSC